mmetsp:Transcript_23515/g.46329  ORF Transcript_23515/g.46329 Transcript_23515/m.46329 type:complete len:225 (+) Transcript_23515:69-743(+)
MQAFHHRDQKEHQNSRRWPQAQRSGAEATTRDEQGKNQGRSRAKCANERNRKNREGGTCGLPGGYGSRSKGLFFRFSRKTSVCTITRTQVMERTRGGEIDCQRPCFLGLHQVLQLAVRSHSLGSPRPQRSVRTSTPASVDASEACNPISGLLLRPQRRRLAPRPFLCRCRESSPSNALCATQASPTPWNRSAPRYQTAGPGSPSCRSGRLAEKAEAGAGSRDPS